MVMINGIWAIMTIMILFIPRIRLLTQQSSPQLAGLLASPSPPHENPSLATNGGPLAMGFFASSGILNRRGFFSAPVSAAPSGIPVASTANVVISNAPQGQFVSMNGTYVKKVNPERCAGIQDFGASLFVYSGAVFSSNLGENTGNILIGPETSLIDDFDGGSPDQIGTPYNNWRLIELSYNSENASWDVLTEILNSSSDPTTIPTSGWSPSITITAA